MSRALRRIFTLLLALGMFLCTLPAFAAEDGLSTGYSGDVVGFSGDVDPDTVYTEAELTEWLSGHSGGTVSLGTSIAITKATLIDAPVTIDTEKYGLVYDGGCLQFNGAGMDALIIGEGVDMPVVDVRDMGRMFIGNWNNRLHTTNVTATGRGGQGGTALRLNGSGAGRLDFRMLEDNVPGLIRSSGKNAVGIELTDPFDLFSFHVQVDGENSTALLAHDSANICFCKLSATGDGAQAVRGGGELVVDSCQLSPAAEAANIAVYQVGFIPAWYPVKQYSDAAEFVRKIRNQNTTIFGGSDATQSYSPSVTWDDSYQDINLDVTGHAVVLGTLYSPWFGDLISAMPEITVDVRDPEIPCLYDTGTLQDVDDVYAIWFQFWMCDEWDLSDCILWHSADDGESWRDITTDTGIAWERADVTVAGVGVTRNGRVSIPISLIDEGAMFAIEAPGFGTSNVAHYSAAFPNKLPDKGGDRIGTDRIGVDLSGEKPAVGNPDPGDPDPGNPDPGDPDPGNPDPGDPDPGDPDPGDPDPGDTDPGNPDPGDTDPGNPDPGSSNIDSGNNDSDTSGRSSPDSDRSVKVVESATAPGLDEKSVIPLPYVPEVVPQTAASVAVQAMPAHADDDMHISPPAPRREENSAAIQENLIPAVDAPSSEVIDPMEQPPLPEPETSIIAVVVVLAAVAILSAAGLLWLKKPWSTEK